VWELDGAGWFVCKSLCWPWLAHGFGTRNSPPLARERVAWARQIHSSVVLEVHGPGCAGTGDALVTATPGVCLTVRTADCLPVILVDPVERVAGIVHAGWRGTAGRIVERALEKLQASFRAEPSQMHAAIGPGIGACCYEVGAEVAELFRHYAGAIRFSGDRALLDLARVNRLILAECGLPEGHIDVAAKCTRCNPHWFYSYRRDGKSAGRMTNFVTILP